MSPIQPRRLPVRLGAMILVAVPLAAQRPVSALFGRCLDDAIASSQRAIAASTNLWSDHSTWDNAWVGTSPHFAVRTTSSHGVALDLAQGLEAMLAHFQQTLATDFAPAQPLQVFVFPDLAAYNQFGNQNGQHHSSFYGSFYAPGVDSRPVAVAWHDNPTWLRMQITHSVVHQYLAAAYPGRTIPTWLDEGLASYFAAYWDYGWCLDEFERLKQAGGVPSLAGILRDGVDRYVADAHARFSELGMLFYYLLRFREDTRTVTAEEGEPASPFRDYAVALLEGRPVDTLPFHAVIGDPAALQRDLLAYEFPR